MGCRVGTKPTQPSYVRFHLGYAPESMAESGRFDVALTKPFRRQELARIVAQALP